MWRFVHNFIAHPLMSILPGRWGNAIHDWTADRAFVAVTYVPLGQLLDAEAQLRTARELNDRLRELVFDWRHVANFLANELKLEDVDLIVWVREQERGRR